MQEMRWAWSIEDMFHASKVEGQALPFSCPERKAFLAVILRFESAKKAPGLGAFCGGEGGIRTLVRLLT